MIIKHPFRLIIIATPVLPSRYLLSVNLAFTPSPLTNDTDTTYDTLSLHSSASSRSTLPSLSSRTQSLRNFHQPTPGLIIRLVSSALSSSLAPAPAVYPLTPTPIHTHTNSHIHTHTRSHSSPTLLTWNPLHLQLSPLANPPQLRRSPTTLRPSYRPKLKRQRKMNRNRNRSQNQNRKPKSKSTLKRKRIRSSAITPLRLYAFPAACFCCPTSQPAFLQGNWVC